MEKLNYLTGIRPDITFAISVVSQFLSTPMTTYLEAILRILRYLKKSIERDSQVQMGWVSLWSKSNAGYCLSCTKSCVLKKQETELVSRSSTKSDYRAMSNVTLKMLWIKDSLTYISLPPKYPMRLYSGNKVAIYIIENHVFHERTKASKSIVI